VSYYSIHDVAVSFMEIGKIVEIFRYIYIEGSECDFDPSETFPNSVPYWSLFVVVLSRRVGIFSIFYSVWE
jgi:hypothetical protein